MSAPGRAREGDGHVRLGQVTTNQIFPICWELDLADRFCDLYSWLSSVLKLSI